MREIRVSANIFYILAIAIMAQGVIIFLQGAVLGDAPIRWWGLVFGISFFIFGRLLWLWTTENKGR